MPVLQQEISVRFSYPVQFTRHLFHPGNQLPDDLLEMLGFERYAPKQQPLPDTPAHPFSIFKGLEKFRGHLGGRLTITLLDETGGGVEVQELDHLLYRQSIDALEARHQHLLMARAMPVATGFTMEHSHAYH